MDVRYVLHHSLCQLVPCNLRGLYTIDCPDIRHTGYFPFFLPLLVGNQILVVTSIKKIYPTIYPTNIKENKRMSFILF